MDEEPLTLPPCPDCSGERRIAIISHRDYYTRCRACGWPNGAHDDRATFDLPTLPVRRVIYLDHHVYVKLVEGTDQRYMILRDRLLELVRLQAVGCPTSDLHRWEGVLAHQHDDRESVATSLTSDVSLHASMTIQHGQALEAANALLEGRETDYRIGTGNALTSGPLNEWLANFSVRVPSRPAQGLIDELRQNKAVVHDALAGVAAKWQAMDAATAFDVARAKELAAVGPTWLAQVDQFHQRVQLAMLTHGPQAAMGMLVTDAPFANDLVSQLKRVFEDGTETPGPQPPVPARVREFLTGPEIQTTPYARIKATVWGGLARRYADNMTKPPDQGMFDDVEHMATYLPYVDAMFVDRRCWQLVTSNPVRDALAEIGPLGRVFSVGNLDDFHSYLDEIEATVPAERQKFADLLYGPRRVLGA